MQLGSSQRYLFLSYASVDRERALALADRLELAGVRVWLDRRSLVGGMSWDAAIVRAIKGCAALAVLCSSGAVASPNVTQELRLAWEERRPILPLLLEAVGFPDEMRYILTGRQWVELLDRAEAAWLPQLLDALAQLQVITIATTAPPEPPAGASLPTPSEPYGRPSIVGRERELTLLQRRVVATIQGQGGVVLIAGEPGIGKTRLAEEAAAAAQPLGARVLWGRCHEGDWAPAYWPWVQIIRAYLRAHGEQTLQEALGPAAAPIAQIMPEVQRGPQVPFAATVIDPAQARFRLFDAITQLLQQAARSQPLILILDDLQWADAPSLLLLQFAAHESAGVPLLFIGTYRDEEVDRRHPLAQTIASLLRGQVSERLLLRGIAEPAVASLIADSTGRPPSQSLVATICRDTDGNPFFVTEIARLLAEQDPQAGGRPARDWDGTIPQTVGEALIQRLERLSQTANRVLTFAAVIGREFSVAVLERVHELAGEHLLQALEEAETAHIITPVAGAIGRFSFSHALVRETLYESVPTSRRVLLHAQVGEALEELYGARTQSHLEELAHHFLQAAPAGTVNKAIAYARLAGDRALASLAYEDAATHYEQAMQVLALAPGGSQQLELDLLLALGDAQRRASRTDASVTTFEQAARIARLLGDAASLARAGLGLTVYTIGLDPAVERHLALLEEALRSLGHGASDDTAAEHASDNTLTAMVLARLAALRQQNGQSDRSASLGLQAVAMARRLGDRATLAFVLAEPHVAFAGPEHLEARLAVTTEIVRLAEEAGDTEIAFLGYSWRLANLLELGDIAAVDAELETLSRLTNELRQPLARWYTTLAHAMRAMLDGDFATCERLSQEALVIAQQANLPGALALFAAQLLQLRQEQGRLAEIEPLIKGFALQNPDNVTARIALAHLSCELERAGDARSEFERLGAHEFTDLPLDWMRPLTLMLLAETCAALGDAQRAAPLYEQLSSYTAHLLVGGLFLCGGPAERLLGILATTLSQFEVAQAHFSAALRLAAAIGSRPWLAHTQYAYAKMLLVRGASGDREPALDLLGQALSIARELTMMRLVGQIEAEQEAAAAR